MAKHSYLVEIEHESETAPFTGIEYVRRCIFDGLDEFESRPNIRITEHFPVGVVAHGEHGMADDLLDRAIKHAKSMDSGLKSLLSAPSQPKESAPCAFCLLYNDIRKLRGAMGLAMDLSDPKRDLYLRTLEKACTCQEVAMGHSEGDGEKQDVQA